MLESLWTRIIFALLCAPGLGMLIGSIAAASQSGFEGARGYAFVYVSLIATVLTALTLPWLTHPYLQAGLALLALIGGITGIVMLN